jgi:hypothetical protein
MRRLSLSLAALSMVPPLAAAAQTTPYPPVAAESHWIHHDQQHEPRQRVAGRNALGIEPSRLGPPPRGFLYHCSAPAGFYPYIPACRTGWQIVPAGAH